MFSSLQLAILVLVAAYLLHRRAELRRRSRATWAALVEKLGSYGEVQGKGENATVDLDEHFSNEAILIRAGLAEGRQQMFHEAGVMAQMADYAERSGDVQAAPVADRLRDHAIRIRIETAKDAVQPRTWRRRVERNF
ncbi:MAG TPA: hypothetical protein VHZ28_10525 [Terracidiphilus sp.]|nr:hypothetical protein [Terracidiphilus sp.]